MVGPLKPKGSPDSSGNICEDRRDTLHPCVAIVSRLTDIFQFALLKHTDLKTRQGFCDNHHYASTFMLFVHLV